MWEWLIEPLAMDLTNTVRDVRGETVDYLVSREALDSWLAAEGDRLPAAANRDLTSWRALREAIAAAFAAALAGEPLPSDAVERINATAATAPLVPRLRDCPTPAARRSRPAATTRSPWWRPRRSSCWAASSATWCASAPRRAAGCTTWPDAPTSAGARRPAARAPGWRATRSGTAARERRRTT